METYVVQAYDADIAQWYDECYFEDWDSARKYIYRSKFTDGLGRRRRIHVLENVDVLRLKEDEGH